MSGDNQGKALIPPLFRGQPKFDHSWMHYIVTGSNAFITSAIYWSFMRWKHRINDGGLPLASEDFVSMGQMIGRLSLPTLFIMEGG